MDKTYIKILDIALARLRAKGISKTEHDSISGSEFELVNLPIVGGCQVCGATIAAYNASPSKTGYLRCAEGCIGEEGFNTVDEFETFERDEQGGDMGNDTREISYYSCSLDDEHLSHTTIDDAVIDYADGFLEDQIPETVTVYGFSRMRVHVDAADILERALERLDEEYADPDGDNTEATPRMIEAAENLARVIESEYVTWACEKVWHAEVRVADYLPPK